jgi:TolA-binding protein
VPGAYLKQGLAFEKLGENANARLILNQLMEKFPDSNEAGIARRKLAQM